MFAPVTFPDRFEPLVRTIEDAPPRDVVATVLGELRAGRSTDELMLAAGFAAMRSSDVPPIHHGGPIHPIAGLHATRNMMTRLPGDWALLPVIQSVAIANRHIHLLNCGPFILPDAEPLAIDNNVDATLAAFERCVRFGEFHSADHYFLYLIDVLPPMQVLEHLLQVSIPKNCLDDHNILYAVYTWRVVNAFGWEDARLLVRPVVRYVTRTPAPPDLEQADGLIEKHRLLARDLRVETGPDETPTIAALSDDIGRVEGLNDVPHLLARALGDGLSLKGTGEALSVGASHLFLRSRTGDVMEVHANTTTNAQRFLLRQSELSVQTKLRALLVWDTGPDVRLLRRNLAPDIRPDPARVGALGFRSQQSLLTEIEEVLSMIPAHTSPPAAPRPPNGGDAIDHLVEMAQQYGNCGHDPAALFMALAKHVCRDDATEMHAYKHHQATYEEFYDTRPSLRWTHLVAAAQGAALARHGDEDVFRASAERLDLSFTGAA